jgi:dolichyl-phosphate beta-glucosyltransferase
MQLSVVMPAFNEARVIASTLQEVKSYLAKNFQSFEIIVVDDKSTDGTLKVLESLAGLKILRNLKNHGKGYTVAKGVKAAQGEWILFMDADNSTRISELEKFWPFSRDYKVLIASRALPESNIKVKQSFFKSSLGRGGNLVSRLLLGLKLKDTQCGFKLWHQDTKFLFAKLTVERWAFDFELLFLAQKYNFKIKEIPVTWVNDFDSKVKWHSYLGSLWQVVRIRLGDCLGKYN